MPAPLKRPLQAASLAGAVSLSGAVHAAGSDRIRVALIGCGGRGTGAACNVLQNAAHGNVVLVALADAFAGRMNGCLGALKSKFPEQVDVPESRRFVGLDAYQKAIDCGVDLVMIASPPGFHPLHFEAAVAAGKHIFVEKPLAVDAPGVRRFLASNELAQQKKLAVAVGFHLRHEVKHREAIQRIHDGAIGEMQFLRAYFTSSGVWMHPRQPDQSEMNYQVNNWYYFTWLSGDHIVEQHVHDLDVANWIQQGHPLKATGQGGRQVRIGPDYGEIFDHHAVEFEYADGVRLYSYSRHIPGCWESFSQHAHGTRGQVSIQGHGHAELFAEGQSPQRWQRGPDGHQLEMDRLVAAIVAGTPYNEGDSAAQSTMTAILGRMATYSGQEVRWEDAFGSTLDLSPSGYTWDAVPQPKPGPDGLYPCATPGMTRAW